MIKFVHKKNEARARGTAKIIITYTFFEIILGLLLLLTNISAVVLIYEYVLYPQYNHQSSTAYYPAMTSKMGVR